MGAGSNGINFDDIEWPLTRVSRSLYTYKLNISKTVLLGTNLLQNANKKPYSIYLMVPLSMTLSDLWSGCQGHDIFRHWISQKLHYRTSIESHNIMRSIEQWHFQWSRRTPNPVFKVAAFLKSNISKTVCFMDKVTKEH